MSVDPAPVTAPPPVLHRDLGDGLLLRDFIDADAVASFAVVDADRERLGPFLPWVALTRTLDDVCAFHAGQRAAVQTGTVLHATLLHHGELVGRLSFNRIDREQGVAEIGYWSAGRGRGFMTRGLLALCDHGFGVLGLHRLELYTVPDNVRSQDLARRCGFVYEGCSRGGLILHGQRTDQLWFGRLRDDPVPAALFTSWPPPAPPASAGTADRR